MSIPINLLRWAGTWSVATRYSQYTMVQSPLDSKTYVYVGVPDLVGGTDPSIPNPVWVEYTVGGGGGGGGFIPQYPTIWDGTAPTTTDEAINRLSMILYGRTANFGILPVTTPDTQMIVTPPATIGNPPALTGTDGVLLKYTPNGAVEWVARMGGTATDTTKRVGVDAAGDIYCSMDFNGVCAVYNSDGSLFTTLTSVGSSDIALLKYNSAGFVQWIARLTGTSNEVGNGFVVDSTGNILLVGHYLSNPMTIVNSDGSTFATLPLTGVADVFLVKFNSAGFGQWVSRMASANNEQGIALAVDAAGNAFVGGRVFASTTVTIFNSDGSTFGTRLTTEGFLVKYNSTGFAQWSLRMTGTLNSLAADAAGNAYIAGQFTTAFLTIFNSDGTQFPTWLAGSGTQPIYLIKYNPAGFTQWATRLSSTGAQEPPVVTANAAGDVFISCAYAATLEVRNSDTSTFTNLAWFGGVNDVAIVKYNTAGFGQWATSFGGGGQELVGGIALNASGEVCLSGNCGLVGTMFNSDRSMFTLAPFAGACLYVYDSTGFGKWLALWGTNVGATGLGVASDTLGNVYGVGTTTGAATTIYRSAGL